MPVWENLIGQFQGLPATLQGDRDPILKNVTDNPLLQNKLRLWLQIGGDAFNDQIPEVQAATQRVGNQYLGAEQFPSGPKLTVPELEDYFRGDNPAVGRKVVGLGK